MDTTRFHLSANRVGHIGVAVCMNDFPYCNTHAGILFRDARRVLWIVHLAWHKMLSAQTDVAAFAVAIPLLDPLEEPYLAEYCAKVARSQKNHRKIPYNLRYDPETQFDNEGNLVLSKTGTGLNCATFVATVFRSAGRPLIDAATWLIREEEARRVDEATQRRFVETLSRGDSESQVQAELIRPEIGSPRIRPQDVAGACLEDELPAPFSRCSPNGVFILNALVAAAS